MLRRKFITRSFIGSILGLAGTHVLSAKEQKPAIPGRFVHMVFFWLKDSTDVVKFNDGTRQLMEGIDEVVSYHIGEPAGTPRDVVDNTYTVCLIATFDTKDDQDAYQVHPLHQQYVAENKDKWTRVQIFDSWAG
jgi:hypothetical protein